VQKELCFSGVAILWEQYALFLYPLSDVLDPAGFRGAQNLIGLDVLKYLHRSCRLLLQRTNERNHVLHLIRRHGLVGGIFGGLPFVMVPPRSASLFFWTSAEAKSGVFIDALPLPSAP